MSAEARTAERRRMVESIFAAGADAGYQYARAHRWSSRRRQQLSVVPVLVWDEAGKLVFTGWEPTENRSARAVWGDTGMSSDEGQWRESREPGWQKDIGYRLQGVLGAHQYSANIQSSTLDDPGWHGCSCGEWEGYWSSFHPHVADQLRILVTAACTVDPCREGTH